MAPAKVVPGSVCRIAGFDLDRDPPAAEPRPRDRWATGDYVVCEVLEPASYRIELAAGDYEEVRPADRIIGALGRRTATLELVGDWRQVTDDLILHTLTSACVLGRCTSAAHPPPPMAETRYLGHATLAGRAVTMRGSVGQIAPRRLEAPVVLIIGTSMDAGKTVSARAIVRELVGMGKRVAGAKLTGVGRFRDIAAMRDAGAEFIVDFVDVGLPSTVVPRADYEPALTQLLSKLAASEPDVVVAEAGASPLEPYNGDVAVRMLAENVCATVLCASDPYAVVGVMGAFEARPDLIAGRATSTEAAVALVEKLAAVPGLNVLDPASGPKLAAFLREQLG